MNAETSTPDTTPDTRAAEEKFTSLLIACDEALAAGEPSQALTSAEATCGLRPRLERSVACLRLLGQYWNTGSAGATSAATTAAMSSDGRPLSRLGRFHIRRELGHGGFGTVFLAHDPLLGREVALKIPRVPALMTPELRERFHHEAMAAARLDHPNLVSVYEAGAVDDVCFITSPYCPGITLADWLQQRQQPVPWHMAATLLITLAEAVQHAHSRGVLHRDLKPANILLVSGGVVGGEWSESADTTHHSPLTTHQPKITDFGLAKLMVEGEPDQTGTGMIVGTPCYMAPEQAAAKNKEVTTAADVYALGAILYEMLTARPPFRADTALATLEQVRTREPVPPRRLHAEVPRDLETICLKCLHKDPRRRYVSAHGLAADLRRLLAGEPIQARAVGPSERLLKWAKRRPAAAAVAGVTCLAAILLIVLSVAFNIRLAEEKGETNQALQREVQTNADLTQANADLTRALYFHRISLAHHEWLANNVLRTEELLEACPPDLRQWEWRYLKRLGQSGFTTLRGHTGEVSGVAFDDKGKRVASASWDGTVKVWDAGTGQAHTLKGHQGRVEAVAFSPDGKRLASAGRDQTVRLWDVATGKCDTLRGHQSDVVCVTFSPDGRRLASASHDKTVKVWDLSTRQPLRTLTHPDRVFGVTFSPDGRRLASGSENVKGSDNVRLWDATSGDLLRTCTANPAEPLIWVSGLAFHPDGQRLASANGNHTVYMWDSTTGKALHVLRGHSSGVYEVCFSPDGERLASAGHDQTVRLWETASGAKLHILRGHTTPGVSSVAFAPDGRRLASGGGDKTVRIWDALTGQEGLTIIPKGRHYDLTCSADGRLVAAAGSYKNGAVAIWDAATLKALPRLPGRIGSASSVAFSPDSLHLASAEDNIVKVWDTKTWKVQIVLREHSQGITKVAYSPDGKRLASASYDKTVKIWDPATGHVLHTLQGHGGYRAGVAFSPDGKLLASASYDKTIRIWNVVTGELLPILRGHLHGVTGVAFDPTGKHLATGSRDATIRVRNLATGHEVFFLKGHTGGVQDIAFSPDGRRLASASVDYTVKLWDPATGAEALTLRAHVGSVNCVAFSPDGTRLFCGGDGMKIWEALPATPR
jgi:WD40 repeat protein